MVIQPPQNRLYDLDEFHQVIGLPENDDHLFELINGEMVEKMPTQEHGELAAWIASLLLNFIRPRNLGRVGVEIRHEKPDDTKNSSLPYVSFIAGNTPRLKTSVPQMPTLAVEIKSPTDSLKKLRDKAHYYLLNGTLMVWLLNPEKKLVEVFTLDDEYILTENDTLDGGNVLPGFTLSVREIFVDPLQP